MAAVRTPLSDLVLVSISGFAGGTKRVAAWRSLDPL